MRMAIQRGLLCRKELEEDHEFIAMIDASGSSSYATRIKGKYGKENDNSKKRRSTYQ